jgi:hypothetical protein
MQYSVPATHDAVTQISGFSFKILRKKCVWRSTTVSKDSTLLKEACLYVIHVQQGEISAPPQSAALYDIASLFVENLFHKRPNAPALFEIILLR